MCIRDSFQIPPGLSPGEHTLRIESPFGAAEQSIALAATSPGIFTLGGGRGAVLNQNGSVNGTTNPARRGEVIAVFGTGFGALRTQGALQVTVAPVTGSLEGQPVLIHYAGAAPGFPGLYQINVLLSQAIPPGLSGRLTLGQGEAISQPVFIAVQ